MNAPCDFGITDADLMKMSVADRNALLDGLKADFAGSPVELDDSDSERRGPFGKYDADEWLPEPDEGGDASAWQRGQDRFERNELGWR